MEIPFSQSGVRYWHRLVAESPSLDMLEGPEDLVRVMWFSGPGVTVALLGAWLDWMALKASSNLNDSIML